jgi:hypothetical protein
MEVVAAINVLVKYLFSRKQGRAVGMVGRKLVGECV